MKSTFVGVRSGVKSEAEKAAGRALVRLGAAPPYIDSGVHLRVHPRTRSFGRLCVILCALLASAACSLPLNGTGDIAAYDFGTAAGGSAMAGSKRFPTSTSRSRGGAFTPSWARTAPARRPPYMGS